MTIEEKAKAYDEVRKKIAIRFGSNVADEIFSQFEMSEDERIRKDLIIYLRSVLSNKKYGDKFIESWIAWLEKQGKNNMGISETTKQELEDNLNKALEKETPESCNKFLEKQDEQKEVVPKFRVGDTIRNIKYPSQVYKITKIDRLCYISGETEYTSIRILIIDQDKWELVEQKPIEPQQDMLSQEQYAKAVDECIYGEQKPTWSEEDEKMLNNAITACNCCYFKSTIIWLKFLKKRLTWKPSDEQLEAVKRASNGSRAIAGNDYLIMDSLYNDLKKLKGE